jgi:hypothetical protein
VPKHPLFPVLRTGLFLALGVFLVCKPKRAAVPTTVEVPAGAPAVFTVDLQQTEGAGAVDLQPPRAPFRGQLTDCRPRVHTRINGGCWRRLADRPPCEEAYRWDDGCFLPVMTAARPATSLGE